MKWWRVKWTRACGAAAAMVVLVAAPGFAATPAVPKMVAHDAARAAAGSLVVYPKMMVLSDQADEQSVMALALDGRGDVWNATSVAKWTCKPDGVVRVESGRVRPVAAGQTTVTATLDGQTATVDVHVSGVGPPGAVSFRNDVLPVLMKAGCNAGACHGSAQGKNGFRLSLFGFEPEKDYLSLTRDLDARRIDPADPAHSLMLMKPTAEVAHEGGLRIARDGAMYETLRRWIAARTPDDSASLATLTGIELFPAEIVSRATVESAQSAAMAVAAEARVPLIVQARYSDGAVRDVTTLALFSSTDSATADVTSNGVVLPGLPGEAFILVRYGTFAEVTQVIVRPKAGAFVWRDVPAANMIDEAVQAKLRKLQILPSGLCSDDVFVRRVYLDVIGLLPTVGERARFMGDRSPDKREKLIDELLARPEFPELWAMKWAEMLRIESSTKRISFKAMYLYNQWLRDCILHNKPMDAMVRELLTADGGNFATPATNFYHVEQEPALIAENVSQVFAGIRIQCAQCHNHPFERWTQSDYYSFAAFFSQLGKKPAEDPREVILFNSGSGEVTNPRTGKAARPKFLGGAEPALPPGADRRKALAGWLTSPENPYFAATFVDRVLAQFLGRGLVDPPDDARVSNPPSHPALRQALARRFVESKYDLRGLVRLVCNSRTYQTAAEPNETNARDNRNFSHAMIRRLPAETLLDALCEVTESPEKFGGLPLGARAEQIADAQSGSYFLDVFGRPQRQSACTCERRDEPTLSQALHLINGSTVAAKIAAPHGRLARMMAAKSTDEGIVEDIYLAALSRRPTREESAVLVAKVKASKDRGAALQDVYWAVLNSKEFVFNH